MGDTSDTIVAFDLYGTLLSTASIAKKLAELFGRERADRIAAQWRVLQLEYSWRLTAMGTYESFFDVTRKALMHALAEASIAPNAKDVDDLMRAYDSLNTFPDVSPALVALRSTPRVTAVIFSNGTSKMLSNSVGKSPDLAPHSSTFKQVVSVEEVKKFKPAPEVYRHLARKVGKTEHQMAEMWLVSSNPFDVVGARACGMNVAWVDRSGLGWTDKLAGEPTVIVKSLEEVVGAVRRKAFK